MKRVLVAGATGYLGGFVARELAARGHFVRALARSPEKLDLLRDSLDEIVEAEVTRPDTLKGVCDGIDEVFSSIGITRQKDGLTFRDVDYQGKKELLDVALRAGVTRTLRGHFEGVERNVHGTANSGHRRDRPPGRTGRERPA